MIKVYFYNGEEKENMTGFMSPEFKWLCDGFGMMLVNYHCVYESAASAFEAARRLLSWGGSKKSLSIRRMNLSNGDVFLIDGDFYVYRFGKLLRVPEFIERRLVLHG